MREINRLRKKYLDYTSKVFLNKNNILGQKPKRFVLRQRFKDIYILVNAHCLEVNLIVLGCLSSQRNRESYYMLPPLRLVVG